MGVKEEPEQEEDLETSKDKIDFNGIIDFEKLQCLLCENTYSNVSNLKTHAIKIHLKIRRWACELCDCMYYDKVELRSHFQQNHPEDQDNFESLARRINKKLSTEPQGEWEELEDDINDLDMKGELVGIVDFKKLQCLQCDKSFSKAYSLKIHALKYHLKIRRWACELCQWECYDKVGQKEH